MVAGTVKWFDVKKGYGFIQQENGQDVFVHFSDITSEGLGILKDGQNVEFDLIRGDIGPKATNVRAASL